MAGDTVDLNRREFLGKAAVALGGATLGRLAFGSSGEETTAAEVSDASPGASPEAEILNYQPGISYRRFGESDIYLSVLGMGSVKCLERAIRRGIERGLNFIHTSEGYDGGRSVEQIGRVMASHRDRVYLAVKGNFSNLDRLLEKLNTEYVDFLMFDRHVPDGVSDPSLREKFEVWKEQGKVRFMGLTTHNHVKECVQAALKTGMYSVVMPTYNTGSEANLKEEIRACEEKGLPIFAMKTMGGIKDEDQPARLRAVLASPAVVCLIKGMNNMETLDRLIEAQAPERLGSAASQNPPRTRTVQCMMCSRCEEACPRKLAIPDMLRCSRYYYDELGDVSHASMTFREIPPIRRAEACEDCGTCEAFCPLRIPIRREIRRAARMFG